MATVRCIVASQPSPKEWLVMGKSEAAAWVQRMDLFEARSALGSGW